jgi:CRP/FNR family transcriptional regulator, cyclic AMP receptor protein
MLPTFANPPHPQLQLEPKAPADLTKKPSASTAEMALAQLPEPLRLLAQRGELKRYRKGQRLIEEGELGDTLFIILAGRVRVYGSNDGGTDNGKGAVEREITYGTYNVGDYFGEMSLDGGPRSASVETLEATTCAVITRHTLKTHIAEHPEFAFDLLAKVIRRARAATLSTKQLALNDVYGRLVLLLNSLAVPQADGSRLISERLTHQEMSNRLGCSREMVSRLMKDLERGGYVRVELGGIVLVERLPVRW